GLAAWKAASAVVNPEHAVWKAPEPFVPHHAESCAQPDSIVAPANSAKATMPALATAGLTFTPSLGSECPTALRAARVATIHHGIGWSGGAAAMNAPKPTLSRTRAPLR